MKIIKRTIIFVVVICLIATLISGIVFAGVNSGGNSIANAESINLSQNYSGSITGNQDKYFYQFTLSSSGRITLKATAYMKYIYYRIYDVDGNQLWSINPYWNSTTETISTDEYVDLTQGTYYFVAEKSNGYTGNYDFTLGYNSSSESFTESGNGSNNSIAAASSIKVNNSYKGQIANNDDKDFYKFTLSSSGRITIKAAAYMKYIYYRIYDVDGNQLWSINPYWNSETETISTDEYVDLIQGTYYFVAEKSNGYTGNYTFQIRDDIPGDVNGDGEVNAKDLTVLAKYVAKISTITDADLLSAADVNKDGDVNAKDLTHLAKYVAKIINAL